MNAMITTSSRRALRAMPFLATAMLAVGACSSCGGGSSTGGAGATAEPVPRTPEPGGEHVALGAGGRRDPRRSPLGTNLGQIYDWSSEIPFVDLFRVSRAWNSAPEMYGPDDQQPVDVDEHGWVRRLGPRQIVRTGMLNGGPSHTRPGRYLVLWEGNGELEYFGGIEHHLVASESRPGRHVFDWDPERSDDVHFFGLAITRTDPADPVRNVRVLLPGGSCEDDERQWCDLEGPCASGARCVPFEESHLERPFNPDFLSELDVYGFVRFMNWQATNDSPVSTWEQRARLDDARWALGRGVPLEIIVELSNRLGVDPWICIPHRADDRYVVEAGRLLAARLAPERRVWLEYSNEVWNAIFEQQRYSRDEGFRRRLAEPHQFALVTMRFYAQRSREVFERFSEGFPDRQRVVRVLGAQAANDWVATEVLAVPGVAESADALAIAPYFGIFVGPEEREGFMAASLESLLDRTERELVPESLGWVRTHRALADQHGLALVAYEAGQHFVAVRGLENDEAVAARLDEINRHPRFEGIYTRYLEGWREAGGGLLMHFVHVARPDQWGRFGAREWLGQPLESAPKMRAIIRFVDSTPRWW